MKKLVLSLLCLLVLLIPLTVMGCETTTPATTSPLFVTTETFNAKVNELVTLINSKADQVALAAQATRIDGLANQSSGANTYTQAEVDAKIAAAVTALKNDQSWITGHTTTSGGTTTGDYGELMDSDGNLELWLERAPSGDADSDVFYTSAGANKASFDFTVVNTDDSSRHDFWIKLSLMPDEDTLPATALAGCSASYEVKIDSVTASAESTLEPFTYSLTSPTCLDKNDEISFKSDNDNVNKSDSESYRITVYVNQNSAATVNVDWFIDYTIKDLN